MKKELVIDKLIEIPVKEFVNMFDLCHKIGIETPNTQDYKQIKNIISEYGIEIKFTYVNRNIKKNNKKIPLENVLCENSPYDNTKLRKRILNENIKEYKCEKCGITEWEGEPISLQIHHINGIHNDNRIENIQLLCPNCHSQTNNFSGKNKKEKITTFGGRKKYIKQIKSWENSHPTKYELLKSFNECGSYVKTGKHYNVSDNSIRKWLKHYNLPLDKKELKNEFERMRELV